MPPTPAKVCTVFDPLGKEWHPHLGEWNHSRVTYCTRYGMHAQWNFALEQWWTNGKWKADLQCNLLCGLANWITPYNFLTKKREVLKPSNLGVAWKIMKQLPLLLCFRLAYLVIIQLNLALNLGFTPPVNMTHKRVRCGSDFHSPFAHHCVGKRKNCGCAVGCDTATAFSLLAVSRCKGSDTNDILKKVDCSPVQSLCIL